MGNMRIKIIGDNLEINDQIRDLVEKKIAKGLEKYLPELNNEIKTADMTISKHSRWGYKINFDMRLPQKQQLYAEARNEDLQTTLVELREKLETQAKSLW